MKYDFTKLDRLLERFAEEQTVPGCAVSIFRGDEVLYQRETGYADIEAGKPVRADSMFRQASTTKLFSYVILAMLYEEGRFLFSDPVSDYLPEWASSTKFVRDGQGKLHVVPTERPVTVRQAVNMTCGLPYCMVPQPDSEDPTQAAMSERLIKLLEHGVPTLREEVRAMADVPLMFEPGTHWFYGFGSEIMGALIETLEDMPLREVFRRRIIEPLGLEHAATYRTDANRENIVRNYLKRDGKLVPAPAELDANIDPAVTPVGARPNLLISAHDYAVFMQMLANGGTYRGR